MHKKEISEIKKSICNVKNSSLVTISICLVGPEKEKLVIDTFRFLSLPEEEIFKYLDIFKKSLGGKVGKSLFNIGMQGEEKEREMANLSDNFELLCDKIIEKYEMPGHYLIVSGYGVYDYPAKHSDGTYDEEADYTYEYTLTSICPVELAAPALSYTNGSIKERMRDWVVGAPKDAILYPSFNDRTPDVHELLYFTKKSKETQEELINELAGNSRPNSEDEEKEWFSKALEDENGQGCSFEVIKEFSESAYRKVEENAEDGQVNLSEYEIVRMLENAGLDEKRAEEFAKYHKENQGEKQEINLNNLTNTSKSVISGYGFSLQVDADRLSDVQTKVIDGRIHLILPLASSELMLNGITTQVKNSK